MALVSTKKMFEGAYQNKYAIGAFNINNMEIIQGVTRACQKRNSAVILQVSMSALKYAHPAYLKKMVEAAIEETSIDIALHLDHGPDLDAIKTVIDLGFTSVMYDGSHHDFETNIKLTKEVVDYAHDKGVVVEAELGMLAGIEDEVEIDSEDATYTNPDQAAEFVQKTGCDSLAIAIGTSHGAYKFQGKAELDFNRLQLIGEKLVAIGYKNYPIVLHGASAVDQEMVRIANEYGADIKGAAGNPAEMLRKATTLGVCKINMDTDIRLAVTAAIRKSLGDNPENFDPRGYLSLARDYIEEMVLDKIDNVLGSTDSMKQN